MLSLTDLTCRVCLQEKEVLINVFDELEEMKSNLCELLRTCGDILVDANDALPKYLCEECTSELLISAKFRDKCSKSNEMLKDVHVIYDPEPAVVSSEVVFEIAEVAQLDIKAEEAHVATTDDHDDKACETMETPIQYEATTMETDAKDNSSMLKNNLVCETNSEFVDCTAESDTVYDPLVDISDKPEESCDNDIQTDDSKGEKKQKEKAFKCDMCGAVFVQAFNLQKHLQRLHAPPQYFVCKSCDHWFSVEAVFQQHQQNCNAPKKSAKKSRSRADEKRRTCVLCTKVFKTPFSLKMHLRTHTGERPYACQYCSKSFKTQSSLNGHIKRHLGQADFKCTLCGKLFFERGNLDVHMLSHTGERPHACNVCKKAFSRVFLLKLHMRIHTGEKPFSCSYCERSFRQSTDLKNHLSMHTGYKQHKCNLCEKSYKKRSALLQHIQTHQIISGDVGVPADSGQALDIIHVENVNFDDIIETVNC